MGKWPFVSTFVSNHPFWIVIFISNLLRCYMLIFSYQPTDLRVGNNYQVDDRVNGYLFPKENIGILTQIVLHVVSKGKLSPLAHNVASIGKRTAKNLMALETIEGYALLLENVLKLPSEVASPRPVSDIPSNLKEQWQWHLFEANPNRTYFNRTLRRYGFLEKVERQWSNRHKLKESSSDVNLIDETFLYGIWEEERNIGLANKRKRREEEEVSYACYNSYLGGFWWF